MLHSCSFAYICDFVEVEFVPWLKGSNAETQMIALEVDSYSLEHEHFEPRDLPVLAKTHSCGRSESFIVLVDYLIYWVRQYFLNAVQTVTDVQPFLALI